MNIDENTGKTATVGELAENIQIDTSTFWHIVRTLHNSELKPNRDFDNDREKQSHQINIGYPHTRIYPEDELPKNLEKSSDYRIEPKAMGGHTNFERYKVIDGTTVVTLNDPWLKIQFDYAHPYYVRKSSSARHIRKGERTLDDRSKQIYKKQPSLFVDVERSTSLHDHAIYIALALSREMARPALSEIPKKVIDFINSDDLLDRTTLIYMIKVAHRGNTIARNFLESTFMMKTYTAANEFADFVAANTSMNSYKINDDLKTAAVDILGSMIGGDFYIFDQIMNGKDVVINTRKVQDILEYHYKQSFFALNTMDRVLQKSQYELDETWGVVLSELVKNFNKEAIEKCWNIICSRKQSAQSDREKLEAWFGNAENYPSDSEEYKIFSVIESTYSKKLAHNIHQRDALLNYRDFGLLSPRVWLLSDPRLNPQVFKPSRHKNIVTWLFGSKNEATVSQKLKSRGGGYLYKRLKDWCDKKQSQIAMEVRHPGDFEKFEQTDTTPILTQKGKDEKYIPLPSMIFYLELPVWSFCNEQGLENKHYLAIYYKLLRKMKLIDNKFYIRNKRAIDLSDRHTLRLYKHFTAWSQNKDQKLHNYLSTL